MNAKITAIVCGLCVWAGTGWAVEKPKIEVAFVLDSTGSMGGLIEGAKQKIWAIANDLVARKPTPDLRLALISYRDRGDEYITKRFDLTDDIDKVYTNLRSFVAAGGGDSPESVNQALYEAVHQISWSKGEKTLRIIFLVGDFPPHMDYPDDVKYPVTCQEAAKRGIIINTVQCGNESTCTPIWQEIAKFSEGQYVQLAQNGNMTAIASPYDAEIAKLSRDLSATVVAWGSVREQAEVNQKAMGGAACSQPVAADRAAYNLSTGGKAVQGRGELLADLKAGAVKLDQIADADLPAPMQKMTAEERKAYLEKQEANRAQINAQLGKLSQQRTDFLEAEKKKLAAKGQADSFDARVSQLIAEQAEKKLGK